MSAYGQSWQPADGAEAHPHRDGGGNSVEPATLDGIGIMPGQILAQEEIEKVVAGLKSPPESKEFATALKYYNQSPTEIHDRIADALIKNPPRNSALELTESLALEWLQSDDQAKRMDAAIYFRDHPLTPKK